MLRCLKLPPQTEILMSAITIKDMVAIAEHHGLRPVPFELDLTKMESESIASLEKLITPVSLQLPLRPLVCYQTAR